jgi:DNA repair protein RecN (Recombination protein N)
VLLELRVKDYAIMEDLALQFAEGLNVLTGETGTGKSIIIDALSLLLGEKADPELIRTGSPKAIVEGVFDLSRNSKLRETAGKLGIELENGVLYVRRIVSREGRGRHHINESSVPLSVLKRIGDETLDIHGQHQHQSLLNTDKHLELLDGFGSLTGDREKFSGLWRDYTSKLSELERLKEESRTLRERRDFLTFQKNEIERAGLRPEEDVTLEGEREILENFEKLVTNLAQVYSLLYEADDSVFTNVSTCIRHLDQASKIDPSVGASLERLRSCHSEIEDVSRVLESYLVQKEFDSERLDEIHKRLDLLSKLKRKYGKTIGDVLLKAKELEEELVGLERLDERRSSVETELEKLRTEVERKASRLSKERKRTAAELENRVIGELTDLGMGNVQFRIVVEPQEDPRGLLRMGERRYSLGPTGMDMVEFLISPNVGEELKPLRKIASGGELSRIMLSIKSILAKIDEIPILVFDEIDVGIGGRTAEAVGRKLRNVSCKRQVLCITHLPQIAAYGDVHYVVNKYESGGRTHTEVRKLESAERVEEMARMLGGEEITDLTRQTAAQLLSRVKKR